jgi:hypothetical protein
MLRDTAQRIVVLTDVLNFYDGGRRWVRANPLREGRPAQAVQMLDMLLEFFGEVGTPLDGRRGVRFYRTPHIQEP